MRMPCRLSNDFLLPTMITFLNDRDWQTRAAFFRGVACMAAHAGSAGMEAFLLPCVEQVPPPLTKSCAGHECGGLVRCKCNQCRVGASAWLPAVACIIYIALLSATAVLPC